MKLYYAPGACSLAPHITAREAGLALDLEKVDLKTHRTETGADYRQVNPKGYVPALQLEDGALLTENAAVLQYLGDQAPEAGLLPRPGAFDRYRVVEWLTFVSTELHKGFGPLFNPQLPEAAREQTIAKLKDRLGYLDGRLAGRVRVPAALQILQRQHVQRHRIAAEADFVQHDRVVEESAVAAFILANQGVGDVQGHLVA